MLTKSDFLKYTQCYKALWLYKYRKDLLPKELDSAMQRIFDEGYKVEDVAYKLFPGGVDAFDSDISVAIANTKKLIAAKEKIIFQPTISNWKLFCRADIIKLNPKTGKWDIYEVKSSTQVKDIHLIDLAFQKICFEENRMKIGRLFLVHVNNKYVRHGEIDPKKLIQIEEITEGVQALIKDVGLDIQSAHKVLDRKTEPDVKILKQCYRPYTCDFIDYCWRNIPEDSIYDIIGGLSKNKLELLLDQGILRIKYIPDGIITNEKKLKQLNAAKTKKVFIDAKAIKKELSVLKYPLYFLDYETYSTAVPLLDGYRPYQRITFQYSLHVKKSPDAKLQHYQYLCPKLIDPTEELSKALSDVIGSKGSVIAWNMGFEMGCNEEMAERNKKYAKFFKSLNDRMYDLMESFKKGYYVHKDFKGSASLKAVLPVVVPKLSYGKLNIQEGNAASESWPILTNPSISQEEGDKLTKDMLDYCQLDTLAMVEILEELKKLIQKINTNI